MALARSSYVKDGQEGVYHCFCRCVRRAFLCGVDPVSQRDYSHRKAWLVDRLRQLSTVFAIEVCAYAIMATHYHAILRSRPDIVATWSDREVATRWLTLFPLYRRCHDSAPPPTDEQISALALRTERIAELRRRLSSLSWFMGRLNEFIARAANNEDNLKGRFWESRFKCLNLLDSAAIAACMVYVDLNPIRAGLAPTPEESDFTSIQLRIRAWHRDSQNMPEPDAAPRPVAVHPPVHPNSHCWLCPIQSVAEHRGILQLSTTEYFDLVDTSGRILRSGKHGAIDADLAPILLRIGVKPDAWIDTISRFQSRFRLAAGLLNSLRRFADQIGRHWLTGVSAARVAFAESLPQPV
jgi:REP element-mobilizing transposase RayT